MYQLIIKIDLKTYPYLSLYYSQAIAKMKCDHFFCTICLVKWIKFQKQQNLDKNCPICRSSIVFYDNQINSMDLRTFENLQNPFYQERTVRQSFWWIQLIMPPLHIKLGLFKQFIKSLDKESDAIEHLKRKYPQVSEDKIKKGILSRSTN